MPRPVRPWFRFYVEAFADRKIRRLKPTQRWVWVAILGAARESHEPGSLYIAPGLPMTPRELAAYADVTERDITTSLTAMESMSMITRADDVITVTNWGVRQFETDDVTKRTRDHRERSRERSNDVPGNAPETETETETEVLDEVGEDAALSETSAGKPAARKHRLPDDFIPNDTNRRIAAERGLDLRAVFEQFADHHAAKGSTMLDWHRAFNTWLRRENAPRGSSTAPQSNVQGWMQITADIAEREGDNVRPFRAIGGGS
jgi:hypothetical protein